MTITTNPELGTKTFTAADGFGLVQQGEIGPSTITTLTGPIGTPDTAWTEVPYGNEPRYSSRAICREVKALGWFNQMKQLLQAANYDWEFLCSNYLSANDPDFQRVTQEVVQRGIISQAALDALLQRCLWTYTQMA